MTTWVRALFTRLRRLLAQPGFAGRGRVLTIAGAIAMAMAIVLGVGLARADSGQAGTTLTVTKTMTAHWDRTFRWTIDKSVSPSTWDLFNGDSGTSGYIIRVTKDDGTDTFYATGNICVANGGAVATQDLQITDNLTQPPSQTVLNSVTVDVSAKPVLNPGDSYCYPYTITIPNAVRGATYKDTAEVSITNHSGDLGNPHSTPASATDTLPSTPNLINDTIHVTDQNGGSWTFNSTDSASYNVTFTCGGDQGLHHNVATITETGQQSSDATVRVNCYTLNASKTAQTYFTRTDNWNVVKQCDQTSLTLALNQSFTVNCTITSSITGHTDSAWGVRGTVTVTNNAPIDATINSVSDVISDIGSVALDCGGTGPYTVAKNGGTLICSYVTSLPDATNHTNTATATQQNYSYDANGNATASGTTDYMAQADVDFSKADINMQDTTASVFDGSTLLGDGGPNTYTFTWTIGPYATCGSYTPTNSASLTTDTTNTSVGPSTWQVNVTVPCQNGCSLTIGYWKTHAGSASANANKNTLDMVTPLLPIWLGTPSGTHSINVTTATQAVNILGFQGQASNGIYKLEGQLLAAKLNIKNGADGSAIASTISAADSFLASNGTSWGSLSKSQQQTVLGWMTTLDNYNNGLIGPGHCSQ